MAGNDLTSSEWQRARVAYSDVMSDKQFITSTFELQNILAHLGLLPPIEDVEAALLSYGGSMDFMSVLNYISHLKTEFNAPEPPDIDTVRAFMAAGGGASGTGSVQRDVLKDMCKHFNLCIDFNGLLQNDESEGQIGFEDFKGLFGNTTNSCELSRSDLTGEPLPEYHPLKLGMDYKLLVQQQEINQRASAYLPPIRGNKQRGGLARGKSWFDLAERRKSVVKGRRESTSVLCPQPPAAPAPHWQTSAESQSIPCPPADDEEVPSSTKKRKKRPKRRMHTSSPQSILGSSTKPCGRNGVYLDDPPRLIPQHMSAAASDLPPLPTLKNGRIVMRPQEGKSEALLRIEERMEEIARRRLKSSRPKTQSPTQKTLTV